MDNLTQTEIDIKKIKKQIKEIRDKEKRKKKEIEDNEAKLICLKKVLDIAVSNFSSFDKLNNSLKNLTQLRFVNSWADSRAAKTSSAKHDSFMQMDNSYKEQQNVIIKNKQSIEELEMKRAVLESKLRQLESLHKAELKNMIGE